jgi:hypothetical protein
MTTSSDLRIGHVRIVNGVLASRDSSRTCLPMKLADYLFNSGLAPSDVQGELGIKSRSTMYRYLTGERRPRREMMQRITTLTNGKVQEQDFADNQLPDCVVVIRRGDGKLSAVLPWSTMNGRLEQARRTAEEPEHELSTPVRRALWLLVPRAVHHGGDRFTLDGRESGLRLIMQEANALLKARGLSPIPYPVVCPKQPPARARTSRRSAAECVKRLLGLA